MERKEFIFLHSMQCDEPFEDTLCGSPLEPANMPCFMSSRVCICLLSSRQHQIVIQLPTLTTDF